MMKLASNSKLARAKFRLKTRPRAFPLATIRKLALPAIQVNIVKKQVNVAGG